MGFDEKIVARARIRNLHESKKLEELIDWCCSDDAQIEIEPKAEVKTKIRKIIAELQLLFSEMTVLDAKAVSTEKLTDSFGWKGKDTSIQHDIHELNRKLFDAIEKSLKGTKEENLIKEIYHGTVLNQIKCLFCGFVSERGEEFLDLTVFVKGFSSLEESLAGFVTPEILDGMNQYFCARCNQHRDAAKGQILDRLPPVLIFPLMRFEYDWQQDKRKKVTNKFTFPTTIDMSPYCAHSKNVAGEVKVGEKTDNSSGIQESTLNPKAEESSVITPVPSSHYSLFAVLIHQGGAYGGHYHAFIRDLDTANDWWNFDDEKTQQIDIEDAISSQFGGNTKECACMNFFILFICVLNNFLFALYVRYVSL
jgi:ubiquitin carboxyl-terminal hydrolase 40